MQVFTRQLLSGAVLPIVVLLAAGAGRAAPASKPGWVTGKAVKSNGQPLSNVEIYIGGTTAAGSRASFNTKSNASGQYAFKVPNGVYHVAAWVNTRYNGSFYQFRLHPLDGSLNRDYSSRGGIVKNFVWKISGLMAGSNPDTADARSYYGASILLYGDNPTLNYDPNPLSFPEGSTIEVTLVPQGTLIDGSPGKTLTYKVRMNAKQVGFVHYTKRTLKNIPVGRYTATARLVEPDGAVKALRIAAKTDSTDVLAEDRLLAPIGTQAPVVFIPRKDKHAYALNGVFGVSLYLLAG